MGDYLGFSIVNQYRCAIKRILREQRDKNANTLRNEDIDSERVNRLMDNVKKRKDAVARANFKERFDGEFTPYKMISEVTQIETYMWEYHCTTPAFSAASLRDRYHFLATYGGVLRSESMYLADLSDLCDFKFKQQKEPHPYHIGIQRVSMGKTNREKVLYGRAMRHREVELSSIGALGLYLMTRFEVTNEIKSIDFSKNSTWFNRKLLKAMTCGADSTDPNEEPMSPSQYTKKMKNTCKSCNIESNTWLHFGRKCAPALMDLEEVNKMDKRALGNWITDVFGEFYSSKLPLAAMRVMAGFDKRLGMHHNPRTTFYGQEKHKALVRMIFPWIETVQENVDLSDCPTARAFINFLINLRWVILQDSAVLIGIKKQSHFIINNMKHIFESELFKDYTQQMIQHLVSSKNTDPNAMDIDRILPGVNEKLMMGINATKNCHTEIKENNLATKESLLQLMEQNSTLRSTVGSAVKSTIISAFSKVGKCMTSLDEDTAGFIADNAIEASDNANENRLTVRDDRITAQVLEDEQYRVPTKFDSVEKILLHWESKVGNLETRNGVKWRKHLSQAERKRFTRVKRIVMCFKKEIDKGTPSYNLITEFEHFYKENKKSLAKLADVFVLKFKN